MTCTVYDIMTVWAGQAGTVPGELPWQLKTMGPESSSNIPSLVLRPRLHRYSKDLTRELCLLRSHEV